MSKFSRVITAKGWISLDERERNRIISSTRITYILCKLIYLFPPNWIRILFSSLSLEDSTRVTISSGAQQMNIRSGWQLNNHWRNESTSMYTRKVCSASLVCFCSLFFCIFVSHSWSVKCKLPRTNFRSHCADSPHRQLRQDVSRTPIRWTTRERRISQREWENLVSRQRATVGSSFWCFFVHIRMIQSKE